MMMLVTFLSVLLSTFSPFAEYDTCSVAMNVIDRQDDVPEIADHGYWKKKKYSRLSYNKTHFSPLYVDDPYPVSLSVGLDNGRNYYLHSKPIAGIAKFGVDVGFDFNYTRFNQVDDLSDYECPSGYTGSSDLEANDDDVDTMLRLSGIFFSLGLAVGPSVTLNPVEKLRLCGYFHLVPTGSIFVQGFGAYAGYSTMLKYGVELSYGFVGLGIQRRSGMSSYTDLVSYYMVKSADGDVGTIGKSRFFTDSFQIYLSYRFGRK